MLQVIYKPYANLAIGIRLKRIEIIKMKNCTKCNTIKPVTEFSMSKATKDGFNSYCRSCQSTYYKAYNAEMKASKPRVVPQSKVCRDCGLEKPISQFGKRSVSPDKHNIYCKPCWLTRTNVAIRKMKSNAK